MVGLRMADNVLGYQVQGTFGVKSRRAVDGKRSTVNSRR